MFRAATKEDADLMVGIRRSAVLAQPVGLWDAKTIKVAASYATAEKIHAEFADHEFYLYEQSGFFAFSGNYLAYLYMLPGSQNGGVGSKMLEFAEARIAQNFDNIWLWSHPYTEKFYERHGFIKQPETENIFGSPLHRFHKTL